GAPGPLAAVLSGLPALDDPPPFQRPQVVAHRARSEAGKLRQLARRALESLVKLVDRDQTGGMGQGAERAGLVNTDVVFGPTAGSTRAFRCGAGHQLIVLLDIRDVKQLLYKCETNASGFDLATSAPASDSPGPGAQFVRR